MLRVRLFGSGRVFDGEAEIKLPSRQWTLPLLAYVLLHAGESIPRWRIAFTLWPDETEETALQNLRRNLHRLVKALPPAAETAPWIETDAESIAWNPAGDFELDVAEFERLRAEPETLERAISFYAGDLLGEIYDDWIGAERERLRRAYHADLTKLILTSRSRRAFASAAGFARRLLDADPWREDVVRHLMSVRYEAGDAAGALGEFDRFARALNAEMGVAPMPETLALREAIVRGESIPAAAGPPDATAKRLPPPSPFVGREAQLGRLRAGWQRAAGGAGTLICIRGEAGIGKSRLVRELALIGEAEGGRVLLGSSGSPEPDPYECFSSALRGALPLVAGVSLEGPLLAAVAELVPELRAYRPDIPPLARLDPDSERSRRIDALVQIFAAVARPRPVLLILEDLHRMGAETIAALRELVPRLSRSAVLILATYRNDDPARTQALRALERVAGVPEPVTLGALTEAEIGMLVAALAPEVDAPDAFIPALIRRSEGNPLFVTELLRDVGRTGSATLDMPASLTAMIDERLASLAPASRTVAEIAAVAGEAFNVDVVRQLAGLPHAEMLDGLDELLDRHLVRESSGRAHSEYAFTHNLVHAAIYAGIPEGVRTRRHRRIARILDAAGPSALNERAAEIGVHYERGGDAALAAERYAAAARRAAQLYANGEARELIDRALRLYSGEDRWRFDLVALRKKMSARLADAAGEVADQVELERLAEGLDDDAVGTALILRIELEFARGDHAAEMQAIERLTRQAAESGSERWLAAAAEARSRREQRACEWDAAIASALEARERYRRLGDDVACVRVTALAAHSCGFAPARAAEGERLAAEAVALAERAGDAEMRVWTLRVAASAAHEREDFARDAELNRKALDLCREHGDRRGEVFCRGSLATVLWDDWHVDEALHQYREALRLAAALQVARVSPIMCNLGGLLADIGEFAGAEEWCRRAEDVALEHQSLGVAAVASLNLAKIAWLRGDVANLSETLERAASIVEHLPESRHEANFAKNRGRMLRCRRDFRASLGELERAISLYERCGRSANAAEVYEDVALTHLGAGSVAAALEALRGAEASARASTRRELTNPILHGWIEACVRRAGGDPEGALEALDRAQSRFVERRDALADPALRASFEALPVHAALLTARARDEWPAPGSACVVAFATARSADADADADAWETLSR